MKALFALTVLIAGFYLFMQQEGLERLKQYLPQTSIEQNAQSLLTSVNNNVSKKVNDSVDKKLAQFKSSLLAEKDNRINALEKQLVSLQTQFKNKESMQTKITKQAPSSVKPTLAIPKSETQDFPIEPAFAKTQYLTGESPVNEKNNLDKKSAMKRQANLQDIAARMNKTSLLALTQ